MSGCKTDQATRHTEDQNSAVNYQAAVARAHSQPMSANDQQTVNDGRPVIACFGDSLTAGYGVDAADSYPSRLQGLLDKAGYHYRVVNLGISGETTKDGLARVDRVLALHPAITVVEFGGNDGLRGLPVASSRANLDSIVDRLRSGGTSVAMAGITLPPQFGQAYIQQFNQTYHLIAGKYSVPLYPFLLQDVWGVSGSIQQDGVHPTAQGCRQVAKNIFGFLQPLLKK
ncbi:arylesterase [Terriglobus sp.]|uniref:arylesterase n=1 Tax=Terriglobus sp. TaxID=1889013 RepID=UPI003B008BAD